MSKIYRCVRDLQGGSFALGSTETAEGWKERALGWLEQDGFDESEEEGNFYQRLKSLKDEKEIIDAICEWWELEIVLSTRWAIAREFVDKARMFVVDPETGEDTHEEVMENCEFWNYYWEVFERDEDDLPIWDSKTDFDDFEDAKTYYKKMVEKERNE